MLKFRINESIDQYPTWVYAWSNQQTDKNKRIYEKAIDNWYDEAEKLYPNFYKLSGKEKKDAEMEVNKVVGYSRTDVDNGKTDKFMDIYRDIAYDKYSVKESVSSEIPYDLVSMLVVIRDFRDTDSAYVSDEHKKLVDIADAIYNNGSGIINYMDDDYKALYNKYGKKYFDLVIDDAEALDSQVSPSNINDLLDDYSKRANSFLGESTNHKKSRKAIKEDTFDNEDWGYGFDSNGDAITESTVEELYRIAEYEILPQSELADYDEYVSINEDSWKFYVGNHYVNEEYIIYLTLTNEDIDFNSYVRTDETVHPDLSVGTSFAHYDAKIEFNIYAKDGRVDSVEISDVSIYRPDATYDSYHTDKFDEMFDSEAIADYVANLASNTVSDIYNATTNL